MARRLLFTANSPLGYAVILDRNRWRSIIRFKHPALKGKEALVRQAIIDPLIIRESALDPDVHLHYRAAERGYVCVAVAPTQQPLERFVVTTYFTRNVKKGREIWTK